MSLDQETLDLRRDLFAIWSKDEGERDLARVAELLSLLKRKLIGLTFLPELGREVSSSELIIARDVLEVGAQVAILQKDLEAFERYMAQLKCYYFDYDGVLEPSAFMNELLGLNLLLLLAQRRLAEFHTELELLPPQELADCIYYRYPIQLEQYLMEGCYNKVFALRGSSPAKSYGYLLDIMTSTVRHEVATCLEKAYSAVSVSEAQRMLFFASPEADSEFNEYMAARNWTRNMEEEFVFSQPEPEGRYVSSDGLIGNTLTYAKELEKIV